ncbi:MAG: MerR family transcriptional regulator [Bacteroidales bacterium]|nr:MerR family transcriptional regulator [Bacteroidales bacterium]
MMADRTPPEKIYYKIKDVAEMLDVQPSTLRFWEKEFPECAPRRSDKNIRYYTAANIERLKMIRYLVRDEGLRIEAARERLRLDSDNISRRIDVIEKLEKVKNELEEMLSALVKRH